MYKSNAGAAIPPTLLRRLRQLSRLLWLSRFGRRAELRRDEPLPLESSASAALLLAELEVCERLGRSLQRLKGEEERSLGLHVTSSACSSSEMVIFLSETWAGARLEFSLGLGFGGYKFRVLGSGVGWVFMSTSWNSRMRSQRITCGASRVLVEEVKARVQS